MTEKPLGKITARLADLGLEVTYAYDDLIFVQECAFLIQFTDDPTVLKLFINTECVPAVAEGMAQKMSDAFAGEGFETISAGRYFITPNEDNTVKLEFNEPCPA